MDQRWRDAIDEVRKVNRALREEYLEQRSDMFDKFILYTRDGQAVVTVNVPHFNPMTEVIIWGTRVFVLSDDSKYIEGMSWVCPPGSEIK